MATTHEITEEHFSFLLNNDDADGRNWVRRSITALAQSVAAELEPDSLQIAPGNITGEAGGWYSCWVTLSRGEKPGAEAHRTIQISPEELEIFANVETRTTQKLLQKLKMNPRPLREILADLDGFSIAVTDRKPVRPQKFEYVRVMEFRSGSYVSEDSFRHLSGLLERLRYPGTYPQFAVRKRFSKLSVLELEKSNKLTKALASAARELAPVVDFINEAS